MERRRLRLHTPPSAAQRGVTLGPPWARAPLPGRCIAVADTEQGQAAAVWALALLEQLSAQGERVPVVLTGFDHVPEPEPALALALSRAAGSVLRLWVKPEAAPEGLFDALRGVDVAGARCWLLLGLPALLAFDAWLTVLVTSGLGVERWPAGLRELRGSLALEVPDQRQPLSRALSGALLTTPEP